MRLLILTDRFPPEDRGGAERIAYYHAQSFRDLGWNVTVLTGMSRHTRHSYSHDGLSIVQGITFPETSMGNRCQAALGAINNPRARAVARRVFQTFKPDVIHAHLVARISLPVATQFSALCPTFVTFHGYHFECIKGALYRKRGCICTEKPLCCRLFQQLNTRRLSNAHRVIAISRFIEARLIQQGVACDRVRYLPNGVPGLDQRPFELLPAEHKVLYVGQLDVHKGVDHLVRAFRKLSDNNATLTIVGDGRERKNLEQLTRGDGRIRMTGWLPHDELARHYRESRVVVVPSLWHEVMNTVICEAQSWSRPVIATDVGGNRDLIVAGVSGILCPPGDQPALTSALQLLLNDTALAEKLGKNARSHVAQFSMPRHTNALLSLYQEAMNEFH